MTTYTLSLLLLIFLHKKDNYRKILELNYLGAGMLENETL